MCFLDELFGFDNCHSKCEKKEQKNWCEHKCYECFVKCCPCRCNYHKKDDCKCHCHEYKGFGSDKEMCRKGYMEEKQQMMDGWGKRMSSCCNPCHKMQKRNEEEYKIHQPAYCPLICPKNFGNYKPDFWEKGF